MKSLEFVELKMVLNNASDIRKLLLVELIMKILIGAGM